MRIEVDQEDDGRWIAEIPELAGVMVYGSTRDAAISKAKALALRVLADRLEHGEEIPELQGVFAITHPIRGRRFPQMPWRESRNAPALPPMICRTGSCIVQSRRMGFSPCGLLSSAASHVIASEARQSPDFRRCPFNSLQPRCHGTSLLRTPRWFPHTSTPRPRTCAQGRFRGVDAPHVPAAGPASQQRRVHLRRSPEAVHGPNPFLKTAHRRIPTERVRFRAPLSYFRPSPPVPGLFSFRARVIFLTDGPTRPIQRLAVPGTVRPFPHPEPPLLFPEN